MQNWINQIQLGAKKHFILDTTDFYIAITLWCLASIIGIIIMVIVVIFLYKRSTRFLFATFFL